MRSLDAKRWLASALISMVGALSFVVGWAAKPVAKPAQPAQSQQPSQQFFDGIAAVVNKHVITLQQVNTQAQLAQDQLRRQNIPVPELGLLQKQVLQRMITEELERQEAERLRIRVSDAQVDQAVQTIAQRHRIDVAKLRPAVEKSGNTWDTHISK